MPEEQLGTYFIVTSRIPLVHVFPLDILLALRFRVKNETKNKTVKREVIVLFVSVKVNLRRRVDVNYTNID